jgi:RHS repeat-associated protein
VDHVYSFGAGLLHDSAGNTTYTPGISQRKNGVDAFFHEDWIGSTRYLTDGSGLAAPTAYRFDAFGVPSASAGPDATSFKFAGGHGYESDGPAGMLQLGARLYDPGLGRFLSPDPISYAGGLNLYEYCLGNPVGHVDPSGLFPKPEEAGWEKGLKNGLGIAGAVIGGLGGGGIGGGSGFLVGLTTGPGAIISGGAGAWQGAAIGGGLGWFGGQALGGGIASGIKAAGGLISQMSGRGSAGSGGGGGGPVNPGREIVNRLGADLNQRVKNAFKDPCELGKLTADERRRAAEGYDWLAENVRSVTLPKLTAAFNRERARYLRGEVERIARTAEDFRKERGLKLE